jgi:hypothetical protein
MTPGRILITCTGGAEAKCFRVGYKPWRRLPNAASLEPYYQARERLIRAPHGGDGVAHTRNGTPIDLFGWIGIQRNEPSRGMTSEVAFGPDGAVPVVHPRPGRVGLSGRPDASLSGPDRASRRGLRRTYARAAAIVEAHLIEGAPSLGRPVARCSPQLSVAGTPHRRSSRSTVSTLNGRSDSDLASAIRRISTSRN